LSVRRMRRNAHITIIVLRLRGCVPSKKYSMRRAACKQEPRANVE